jgi:hypothetical protein
MTNRVCYSAINSIVLRLTDSEEEEENKDNDDGSAESLEQDDSPSNVISQLNGVGACGIQLYIGSQLRDACLFFVGFVLFFVCFFFFFFFLHVAQEQKQSNPMDTVANDLGIAEHRSQHFETVKRVLERIAALQSNCANQNKANARMLVLVYFIVAEIADLKGVPINRAQKQFNQWAKFSKWLSDPQYRLIKDSCSRVRDLFDLPLVNSSGERVNQLELWLNLIDDFNASQAHHLLSLLTLLSRNIPSFKDSAAGLTNDASEQQEIVQFRVMLVMASVPRYHSIPALQKALRLQKGVNSRTDVRVHAPRGSLRGNSARGRGGQRVVPAAQSDEESEDDEVSDAPEPTVPRSKKRRLTASARESHRRQLISPSRCGLCVLCCLQALVVKSAYCIRFDRYQMGTCIRSET